MYGYPSGGGDWGSQKQQQQQQQDLSKKQKEKQNQSSSQSQNIIDKVERAVTDAHLNLISAGENVTSWKVTQDALLNLKLESWTSLGFPMQEVPSLYRLMLTEGKINSFIHCFVGVQRITTLYDLEVAICKNEGVDEFEKLELGPLLRHPLVLHYFSLKSDVTQVFKITTEEVFPLLRDFMYKCKNKEIKLDEFLDFIVKKTSVESKEKLGLRIHSLGMHKNAIRKALNSEMAILKKPLEAMKSVSSSEEEKLDDANSPSQNVGSSDRVTCCPYPSEIGERTWLGLKGEMCVPASGSPRHNESSGSSKKKRKTDKIKLKKKRNSNNLSFTMSAIAKNSMTTFITTWKEACRENTVPEVFERMLQFYDIKKRRRKKMNLMFSSFPLVGLLTVAVSSIKSGMWDSIYDTFLAISQQELNNTPMQNQSEYEIIDVEPSVKDAPVIAEHSVELTHSVSVEDIIRKVAMYFELDHEIHSYGKSLLEKRINILRKLYKYEFWLAEQFSVKTFKSLGYGEFLIFLEKHASLLPDEIYKFLTGDICEKSPLEVCMLQHQLVVLVSQALNGCLWEKEMVTKQMISSLLMRQFPLISFKISENGFVEDFLDILGKHKNNAISKGVLFSVTLFEMCHVGDSSAHNENDLLENTNQKAGALESVTSKVSTPAENPT